MYGFKIINIFPESSPNEDWADFADSMSKILKETKTKDKEAMAVAIA